MHKINPFFDTFLKFLLGTIYRLYLEFPFRLQWEEYILAKIQVLTAEL